MDQSIYTIILNCIIIGVILFHMTNLISNIRSIFLCVYDKISTTTWHIPKIALRIPFLYNYKKSNNISVCSKY